MYPPTAAATPYQAPSYPYGNDGVYYNQPGRLAFCATPAAAGNWMSGTSGIAGTEVTGAFCKSTSSSALSPSGENVEPFD
ncbi:hypothetical protein MRX96_032581 [Rhipicephalus microplus]